MSLTLSNYPLRVESHFAGRSFTNGVTIESVWRKRPQFGSASTTGDYVAVLAYKGERVVVSYSKLTSALRSIDQSNAVLTLFAQNRVAPGATAPAAPAIPQTVNNPAVATAPINTQDTVRVQAQIGTLITADTALDLMSALVKAARQDAKIANVVKSLAALV